MLQALDAGGKDGLIRKAVTAFNPQGARVTSFGVPSEEELRHDFLWRVHAVAPGRGPVTDRRAGVVRATATSYVRIGMKHRWVPAALGAMTLVLAACAPQQGGGTTAEPTAAGSAAATSHEGHGASESPIPTVEPSETPVATPDDYEY